MSVVNYQTLIVANHQTYSITPSRENATQTEAPVSASSIATYSDDGEKIFNANFGTKQNYDLYNYTADPTESPAIHTQPLPEQPTLPTSQATLCSTTKRLSQGSSHS